MNEILALLVPALGFALLHFLWQGTLVGLLAWLALALLRNARPQARYAVACLALLACVSLPAWSLLQALSAADAAPATSLALATGGVSATPVDSGNALGMLPAPSMDALPWLVALWAAGVATLGLRMACGWLWVRRLCHEAQVDLDGRWQSCVDRAAPRLGIVRKVALRLVDEGDSPLAAGWWRPVVLLPVAVAARLPADLVEALIAHELAHIRRHDYLVNLLQGAAEALLFYHPVVWLLSRRIRVERELVADDLAVAVLGEPRRLALALSELDRHAGARSPTPHPHYAPAAHGGHLMSRIQQLIRPQRRAVAGIAMLPLIGLAVAGAAFYAHAHLAPSPVDPAQATTAPPATIHALPAPKARPGVQVLPAADSAAAPRARVATATPADDNDRPGYALVLEGRDGYTMSGDMDDRDGIDAARRAVDGDFLWFRRDGKAWVVRDAGTIARARAAWARTDELGERMQALEARMEPHSRRMQALGERMAALSVDNAFESPEGRAAIVRMEALGERMAPLAERQVALAMRMREANDADRARMEQQGDQLERERDALQREMRQHSTTLQALSARMEARTAPMHALGREMEAASEPMKGIGKEMEALGTHMEREATAADGEVRRLIDQAYRNGQARPAPLQQ
ncbi:M56 family metallopeptidase [Lysobacter sp. F6437]|uniref:M56 family metallopeptidase n=1 Tax=Lysobacter sp. F6437 TaxID=3459296 RepID=UPI00403E0B69